MCEESTVIYTIKNKISNLVMAIKSLFWKRNDKVVLVGSWFGEKFADNSRYLYQYLFENKEQLNLEKVVWVTRNKALCNSLNELGYESYMMDSTESIYYHKHAGWHIVCNNPVDTKTLAGDIDGKYSFGVKRIQLWHGVGLKGVGFASNEYKIAKEKSRLFFCIKGFFRKFALFNLLLGSRGGWNMNCTLSTTIDTTTVFTQYFGQDGVRYIESSYPRNCKVPFLLNKEREVLDKFKNFKTVILYLPTFRTGDNKLDFTGFSERLKNTLEDNNILWVQKAHSADRENKIESSCVENVLNLDPNFDINVLLPHITLLVTDYSSVMFDAMYHRKPVLYLVPDFNEYKNGDRGFVIEPDSVMCGPKFFTIDELKQQLPKFCHNPKLAIFDGYEEVREKYWGNTNKEISDIWDDIVKSIMSR